MANSYGRQVVLLLTNKSGGGVVAGDVVILDTGNATAFTTTTTARSQNSIGIVQETIANNAIGRVLVAGYAALVNVPSSVTIGHYLETHTVAKQATGNSTRRSGSFGQFFTSGTTPSAWLWGQPDQTTSAASFCGWRVYNSGNVALSTASETLITFDSERYDSDAFHSTVTNTGRATIPTGKAGKYHVGANIRLSNTPGDPSYALIQHVTAGPVAKTIALAYIANNGSIPAVNLGADWDAAVGDYFQVFVFALTASKNALNNDAYSPEFWGHLIGQ